MHAFRGAGIYIAGTVGNTNEVVAGPDTGGYYTARIPGVDLAATFLALYGLDISSLTGGVPPPPPPPPPIDPILVRLTDLEARVTAIEKLVARPIPIACKAGRVFGIAVSCTLTF